MSDTINPQDQRKQYTADLLRHTAGTTQKIMLTVCMDEHGNTFTYKAGNLYTEEVLQLLTDAKNDLQPDNKPIG